MAIAQAGGIGVLLVMVVAALMFLANPMAQALNAILPMAPEPALAAAWDEEMDLLIQAVVIDPAYSHAVEEHPDTAPIVHDCLAKKGQYIAFQIEPKKRYLRVCLVNDTTVGFQIIDIVGKVAKEKTAYIKDNIKCLKELFDYARRMGYSKFTRPF